MSSGSAGWHSRLLLADIFGDQVDISIRGRRKFQTFFGSFLGLSAMLLIVVYSVGVVFDIVDVSTPEVTNEDKYDYENHSFDISNSELIPMFTLLDRSTGKTYEWSELPNIMKPVAKFVDQTRMQVQQGQNSGSPPTRLLQPAPPSGGSAPSPPSASGGPSGSSGPTPSGAGPGAEKTTNQLPDLKLQWVPCTKLVNRGPYTRLFNNNFNDVGPITGAWCLEIPQNASAYTIRGASQRNNPIVLRLQFFPCDLSTCYNSTVLDSVIVHMVNIKSYLQNSNFTDPIQKVKQENNDITLNTELGSSFVYDLKTVKISSITNWFIGSSPDQEFVDIAKDNLLNFNRAASNCAQGSKDCAPFFTFEYRSSGIVTTYKRKYTELLTATSNIGGLKELVMVVGVFIYGWYNQIFQRRYLSGMILNTQKFKACSQLGFQQNLQSMEVNSRKVGSSPLENSPAIQASPSNTSISTQNRNTTTFTSLASPSRLVIPKSGVQLSRVRPRSRSSARPGLLVKQNLDSGPAVKINISKGQEKPQYSKVILKEDVRTQAQFSDAQSNWSQPAADPLSLSNQKMEEQWAKSLQLEAEQLSQEILSVEALLTELATARVLTRMIFSDHHKKLVPLVEIECRRRHIGGKVATDSQEQPVARRSFNLGNSRQPRRTRSVQEMDLSRAIETLKSAAQSQQPATPIQSCACSGESLQQIYRPLIDRYFAEMLFGPTEDNRSACSPQVPDASCHVKSPVASPLASHTAIQHKADKKFRPEMDTPDSPRLNPELQSLDL